MHGHGRGASDGQARAHPTPPVQRLLRAVWQRRALRGTYYLPLTTYYLLLTTYHLSSKYAVLYEVSAQVRHSVVSG